MSDDLMVTLSDVGYDALRKADYDFEVPLTGAMRGRYALIEPRTQFTTFGRTPALAVKRMTSAKQIVAAAEREARDRRH